MGLAELEIPGKEQDEICDWLDASDVFLDGKLDLQEFAVLVGGAGDVLESLRKKRKQFNDTHFVPNEKRAIFIGNKEYEPSSNQKNLDSAEEDAVETHDFMVKKCNFERKNVKIMHNANKEELTEEFKKTREWANKLTSGEKMQKGLLFVYYSGHGMIKDSVTSIICPDGQLFPLPLVINCANKKNSAFGLGIANNPNIVVICVMDCCRILAKGGEDEEELTKGEYHIFYAVQPGTAASGSSSGMSKFTKDVLEELGSKLEKEKKLDFPECMDKFTYCEKGGVLHVNIAAKAKAKQ